MCGRGAGALLLAIGISGSPVVIPSSLDLYCPSANQTILLLTLSPQLPRCLYLRLHLCLVSRMQVALPKEGRLQDLRP